MTRPLSKHRQQLEELQRQLTTEKYWRNSAGGKVSRLEKELEAAKEEVNSYRFRCAEAETNLEEVRTLWNQWIEAEKGGNAESKQAYVTFEPEVFKQLLSLLHP